MTTARKKCIKCERVRAITMFYKHKNMADGHLNKCIDCTKSDVLKYQEANRDKVREYDRKRYQDPKRKAYQKKRMSERREEFPGKARCRNAVSNALRDGKLVRGPCEVCGTTEMVQAHHDDYRRPLVVRWLCFKHHRQLHGQFRSN